MAIPNSSTDYSSNRTGHGMVYENGRTQLLIMGGRDVNKSSIIANAAPIDLWRSTNDGTTWDQLSPTTNPSHRYYMATCYSSNSDGYTYLHGGLDSIGVQFFGDLWFFDGTTWAQFATTFTPQINAPSSRFGHQIISLDGYNNILLTSGIGTTLIDHQNYLQDTWLFSTTSKIWTQISSTNTPPARAYFGVAYDGYNCYIAMGEQSGQYLNDIWTLNALQQQWSQISTTGTKPSERCGIAMCYDSYNGQIIIFGGKTSTGVSNETFILKNNQWQSLTTNFHPTRRYNSKMIFDSSNNTIVLFGGQLADGSVDGSVWIFDCTTQTWTSGAGDYSIAAANGPVSDR